LKSKFGHDGKVATIAPRLSYDEIQLKKLANTPSPFTYVQPERGIIDDFSIKQVQKNVQD
jgi:hypothetical protein